MLILDDFKAHKTSVVKERISSLGTRLEYVIPGYTCALQVLDVGINMPFKVKVKECYNQWLSGNNAQLSSKLKRELIAEWVCTAWDQVGEQGIVNTWNKVLNA